ncbi:chorismate synthase [Peptoniphilus raoultii]|uniref:chorismate synthase n=1 Tax=Peptoniphilus raoultii TaxID=1776387 RepID=UPI0008DAA73E|nr:chorismate synthase [Peptoniphilus raoultii]
MSTIGNKIKFSLFGESHGPYVGGLLENLRPGLEIRAEELENFMKRRQAGKNFTSKRFEEDKVEFISGIYRGKTTGAPLAFIIENKNQNSRDYERLENIPRPSHADYTASVKYKAFNDPRGGGHFSGRLTAPICAAGFIALKELERKNIRIYSHLASLGNIFDQKTDDISEESFLRLRTREIPMANEKKIFECEKLLKALVTEKNSIGASVGCKIIGLPRGLGGNLFDSLKARLASYIFALPACIGLEFGSGFNGSLLRGSENNDEFYFKGRDVKTRTNNSGGIQGGITNGMDLIFRAAFKPTPSIGLEQKSIYLNNFEEKTIKIEGRHDPCIGLRVLPAVESLASLALLDRMEYEKF